MVFDGPFDGLRISRLAEFDKPISFVEDVPNDLADPMGESPNSLYVAETHHETLKDRLEMASVGSGGSLSSLTQQASEESIPFGASA